MQKDTAYHLIHAHSHRCKDLTCGSAHAEEYNGYQAYFKKRTVINVSLQRGVMFPGDEGRCADDYQQRRPREGDRAFLQQNLEDAAALLIALPCFQEWLRLIDWRVNAITVIVALVVKN